MNENSRRRKGEVFLRSPIGRLSALLLCLFLAAFPCFPAGRTAGSSARGESFRAAGETEANRKAFYLLLQCAFSPEYSPEESMPLTRWEQEITVWAGGSPTREDLEQLDSFLRDLNGRVPDFPGIRRVRRDTDASVRVWFVPEYMMKFYFPAYVEGNWGFFSYKTDRCRIVSARIGIASDVTEQEERNHLILEELTGALGLPGDHLVYSDSILYERWTATQHLSEVDWRMLSLLYSPLLSPGMTEAQVRAGGAELLSAPQR